MAARVRWTRSRPERLRKAFSKERVIKKEPSSPVIPRSRLRQPGTFPPPPGVCLSKGRAVAMLADLFAVTRTGFVLIGTVYLIAWTLGLLG